MVRHSTVKTRRRGGKVTRKPRMHPKLRVVKKVKNPLLKEVYNPEISPIDNLEALGFATNANGLGQPRYTRHPEEKKEPLFPGFVGYVETLPPASNKPRNVLTEDEIEYIEKNLKKHGNNYKAMERDMKTNYNQYTEAQMKKLHERYLRRIEN